jgi:hypothetical protein
MNHDGDLQSSIENNDNTSQGVDADAYRLVFGVLNKDTDFRLPPGFADRLVSMLDTEVARKESRRDRLWLIMGIVGMIGALVYAFLSVDFTPRFGVFTFVSVNWPLIIFGMALVTVLHLVDKFFLRKLHSRH